MVFIIGLLVLFISTTRIGLQPIGDWETIGVPLWPPQITIAFIGALLLLGVRSQLLQSFKKFLTTHHLDFFFALTIWLIAIFAWQSIPMKPTFNAPSPSPPNYEYYPHSGAAWQDVISQNLLIGEGYKPDEENEKPLYTMFLAGLHALAGQDYEKVVNLQIVFVAAFPVILYLFAKVSFNRLLGLLMAFLVIMRERNALILMSDFDISHSKLLLTDMPGTILLAAFITFSLSWLHRHPTNRIMAFISGGLLGTSMLIRNQSIVLIAVVILVLFIQVNREWKKFKFGVIFFSLGVFLLVMPWLWRNFQVTGHLFTVLPDKGKAVVKRFIVDEDLVPQYDDLTTMGDGIKRLIEFSGQHPTEIAQFLKAHFLHNEISTLFSLPVNYPLVDNINEYINLLPYWENREEKLWANCCSLEAYVEDLSYWGEWDGTISNKSNLPVFMNIILISIGIGVALRFLGLVGLYPLMIHLLYNLSSVIWGISGWRFILPVDWIGILYFCLGLVYLTYLSYTFFSGKEIYFVDQIHPQKLSDNYQYKRYILLGCIIFGIGLAVPIIEQLIPQRYSQPSKIEAMAILQDDLELKDDEFEIYFSALIDNPDIEPFIGTGLYPRFYEAGDGEPGTAFRWPIHTERDFNRLGFYLAGPTNWPVIFPTDEIPEFPNTQEVLVFGCRVENYLIAQVVMVSPDIILTSSLPCSFFGE